MKNARRWGLIALIGMGIFWVPRFITQQVNNAYKGLHTQLEQNLSVEENRLRTERDELFEQLYAARSAEPPVSDTLERFVMTLDQSYGDLREELETHRSALSMYEPLFEKDENGRPNTTTYWMGEGYEGSAGPGEGNAKELKEKLNAFRRLIMEGNQQVEIEAASPFEPKLYDQEVRLGADPISWEKFTFQGSVSENLAQLEALALEQAQIYRSEIQLLKEALREH